MKILYFIIVLAFTIVGISNLTSSESPPVTPIEVEPGPVKVLPGDRVKWLDWPKQRDVPLRTPFLTDVLSHLPESFGNQYFSERPWTWCHETTHGINAHVRNVVGGPINGPNGRTIAFYVGDNKAVLFKEPTRVRLSHVAESVPKSLRGERYNHYLIQGQAQYNDAPLYALDEWVAYTNGAIAGLENVPKDNERYGVMVGPLEFTGYAIGTLAAIDKYEPEYLNEQFKEFIAHELRRAIATYKKGVKVPQYKWDTPLELNLKNNKELNEVLKKVYGNSLTLEILFNE